MSENLNNTETENSRFVLFEIDENNFNDEKFKINEFLEAKKNASKNVTTLKEFPPCLIDTKNYNVKSPKKVSKKIVLSKDAYVLSNNLYFGDEFKEVNKRFRNSPFISESCKKCQFYLNNSCRGLTNNKFKQASENIIQKRGKRQYDGLKLEYSNGIVGYNSECNINCFFCESVKCKHLVWIIPELEIPEIMHFLHYLPEHGAVSNIMHMTCISGEPLNHSKIELILDIIAKFSLYPITITTNGIPINNRVLDKLREHKSQLILSLHTCDSKRRQELMGYKETIDMKELIKNIQEHDIPLIPVLIPFRQTIESGDLEESIKYLLSIGLKPSVYTGIYNSKFSSKQVLEELAYDSKELENYLKNKGLLDKIGFTPKVSRETIEKIAPELDSLFSEIISDNPTTNIMVLAPPDYSYPILKEKLETDKINIIKTESDSGFNVAISSSLEVYDFIRAVNKFKHKTKDNTTIIIPRLSFNQNLEDLMGNSINKIIDELNINNSSMKIILS